MSAGYLDFVGIYAMALIVASLLALTHNGQHLILSAIERLGRRLGVGPWGLLHGFGHEAKSGGMSVAERAGIAESYVVSAEEQTLRSARVVLWVMIAGCVASGIAAVVIIGVLPPLVLDGRWTYQTYQGVAQLVVYGAAGGGLAMGAGLLWWLLGRTIRLNRTEGCAAARGFVHAALSDGIAPDVRDVLSSGRYPRLSRLLDHASA
jgi:hypothetical protein